MAAATAATPVAILIFTSSSLATDMPRVGLAFQGRGRKKFMFFKV
jgi:hypothetical protein